MLVRLVFAVFLVVIGVAAGFTVAGGNPVDAIANPSSDVAGGSFGTVKITEKQLKVRVTAEHPDFDMIVVKVPDGSTERAIGVVSAGEYSWTRRSGYPSGEYTVKGIANKVSGPDVTLEEYTLTLEAPG